MTYLKKELTPAALDTLRINLSVQAAKMSAEPVCDFCGSADPVSVYADLKMSNGLERPAWRWCACGLCEKLVDASNWGDLQSRVTQRLLKLAPGTSPRMVAAAVAESWKQFNPIEVKG